MSTVQQIDQMFERVRVTPVADAISRNRQVLDRIALTGIDYELPWFTPKALENPIRFRRAGRTALFTHLSVAAYAIGGDIPDPNARPLSYDRMVDVFPIVSLRIQNGANANSGMITRVDYEDFKVPETDFEDDTPDLSNHLVPVTFSVQRGDHLSHTEATLDEIGGDPEYAANFVYGSLGDEQIGGPTDRGDIAWLAAKVIDAAAQNFGTYDQATLNEMARLG